MQTNGRLSNYINGRWQESTAGEFADIINPATAETLAQVPLDGEADVKAAIESAAAAFPGWRRTPPEERIQFLFKLKQLLEDHLEDLAAPGDERALGRDRIGDPDIAVGVERDAVGDARSGGRPNEIALEGRLLHA